MNEAAGAYYPGAIGYTVNFTGSAWVRAHDEDDDSGDDWLVADHLMVPTGTTGSSDKQTNEIVYYRITETDVREIPFVWRFTDTGTGVFGGKLEYRVAALSIATNEISRFRSIEHARLFM